MINIYRQKLDSKNPQLRRCLAHTHLYPVALFQQACRRILVREGSDVGERGDTSKFGYLYSSTTPRKQMVDIDEQIAVGRGPRPSLTHTLIIWTDPTSF